MGAETNTELSYLFDKTNGATLQAIPFAHTLAGLKEVLGDFAKMTGRLIKRRSMGHLIDAKKDIPRSAEDQVMVHGQLESGAAFSAHYRGGLSRAFISFGRSTEPRATFRFWAISAMASSLK